MSQNHNSNLMDTTEHSGSNIRFLPHTDTWLTATPEEMLDAVIQPGSKADEVRYYLETHPGIVKIVLRLAHYLTPAIPGHKDNEASLFNECLSLGISEWGLGVGLTSDPLQLAAYFLRGLLAPLPWLADLTVRGISHERIINWDPTHAALGEWAQTIDGHPMVEIKPNPAYWSEILPVDFRSIIGSRFLFNDPDTLRIAAPHWDSIVGR